MLPMKLHRITTKEEESTLMFFTDMSMVAFLQTWRSLAPAFFLSLGLVAGLPHQAMAANPTSYG
jgi:hypothetical protein